MESTTQSPQTHKRRSRNVSTPSLTSQKALISPKWYMATLLLFVCFFLLVLFCFGKFNWCGRDTHYTVGKCLRRRFFCKVWDINVSLAQRSSMGEA